MFISNYIIYVILLFIILISLYGYYSGSCKINKKYPSGKKFTLIKTFHFHLSDNLRHCIHKLIGNTSLQKRVSIKSWPETLLNCAFPS